MRENLNFSAGKVSEQTTYSPLAEKSRTFFKEKFGFLSNTVIPKVTGLLFKLHILKEVESEFSAPKDTETTFRLVNLSNYAKQSSLLDLAVITSPELQDCIIEEKTLKEMSVEFQLVKNKLFLENNSPNGNFIYEGALVETTVRHFEDMSSQLKKLYIDLFREEIYPYHCGNKLEFTMEDLLDESWMGRICEKLSNYHHMEIMTAEYPVKILNKFKFMYMLIKLQEVKHEAIMRVKSRN